MLRHLIIWWLDFIIYLKNNDSIKTMKKQNILSRTLLAVTVVLLFISCSTDEPEIVIPVAPVNYALQFNGLDGHVMIENSESLNPINAISISMWVRRTGFVDCDNNENWVGILNKSWPWETLSGYAIQLEENGAIYWWVGTEVNYVSFASSSLLPNINEWAFLTFIYDASTSEARVYRNGVLATNTEWNDRGQGKIVSNSDPVQLNTPALSTCTEERGNFPGSIDDLSIWNKVLTAEEIKDMMENSLDGTEAGLISYWPFEEGINNSTIDKTGKNDGTLTGGVEWITR